MTFYEPYENIPQLMPNYYYGYDSRICDVWAHNLHEEFGTIRYLIESYNYVALDTEFPGSIARPVGDFVCQNEYHFQMIRLNVDLTKVIQIGFTLFDSFGRTPKGLRTWQFNFAFNIDQDIYSEDAIQLLESSGVQFEKLKSDGIDAYLFSELLMSSGIILSDNVKWISFQGGYDFAYLIKLLTDQNIPHNALDFNELLNVYFPIRFDIKFLMNSLNGFTGGLQEIAKQLGLKRIGRPHQAGSDSYLSGAAFFKLCEIYFNGLIDDKKYSGFLYGLDISFGFDSNLINFE